MREERVGGLRDLELIFERETVLINRGLGYERRRELREMVQTVWDMGLELIFDR